MGFLISFVIGGLVAGAIARLLVSGTGGLGLFKTIGIGMIGSFIGGFLGYVLFDHDFSEGALQPSGLFGSIVGAVLFLVAWKWFDRRNAVH